MYYTLAYAPSNLNYDGKERKIHVEVTRKGYALSYRRSYYGTEPQQAAVAATADDYVGSAVAKAKNAEAPVKDSLSANMEYGAPEQHQLVFVVQAQAEGSPVEGTVAEMAELATEPAYFRSRRKSATPVVLAPIPLQKDVFNFNIPTRQFKGEHSLNLELAAAAYDAEGRLMNAFVRIAKKDLEQTAGAPDAALFFRVEQELEVPVGAASLRLAVRDVTNDRTGAMEITLPLPREQAGR